MSTGTVLRPRPYVLGSTRADEPCSRAGRTGETILLVALGVRNWSVGMVTRIANPNTSLIFHPTTTRMTTTHTATQAQ
jgi:hypothetical protein